MAGTLRRFALLSVLGLFILFLYGPTLTILVLSFQGPDGGLTFPMNGFSVHWFRRLFETQAVGDFVTLRFMSGGQSASVGLMMANQISLLQYPAAAANAVVLLAVVLTLVAAILRVVDIRREL